MTTYCGHCGLAVDTGDHTSCAKRLQMEPPRYCAQCRRRMIVQVTPDDWSARCVEHGSRGPDS